MSELLAAEIVTSQPSGPEAWVHEWQRCVEGDSSRQSKWKIAELGEWAWDQGGAVLRRSSSEWTWLARERDGLPNLRDIGIFVLEVSVSGKANAAGISFGAYRDFLTPLDGTSNKRRLQLEVDASAGTFAFRVDGTLTPRNWWDSAIRGTDDILDGHFTLKARGAEQVIFEDLRIHALTSSCRISVIMTCHRFQQRLRVCLRNWCNQNLPSGAYEILVVNPSSPDGTHELLAAAARSYPHIRVREIQAGAEIAKNKGKMINNAVRQSRGEWIWLTDSDCLFPPDSADTVLGAVSDRGRRLYFGQRRYLSQEQTDGLLTGRFDGLHDFGELASLADRRGPENAPWGYTQIAHRVLLERFPYTEQVNHFAHSDDMFIRECHRQRVRLEQIAGLFCLHLHHPFAWYGTDVYL